MTTNMTKARTLLDTGAYTCAVCREDILYTATARGVKPLLSWLDEGLDLTGFSAADRVVGRATAFLYVLLGVEAVYANVMSRPAAQVLESCGICASWGTQVDGIINRAGTGPCPFEAAVLNTQTPQEALAAIREKMAAMTKG